MSFLVTLLSISFFKPLPPSCNNELCNALYTPTTVRVNSCDCNELVQNFVYPSGYKDVRVNYNMSYPISHDFYQNNTLIGSCPEDVLCNQRFMLNPRYEVTAVITERDNSSDNDENMYELIFNKY